jgi:hypothetical protein
VQGQPEDAGSFGSISARTNVRDDEHGQKQNAELGPGEAKGELGASDDRPHAVAGLDTAPRRFSSSSFAIAMWLFRMNNRCE